MFKRILVPVDGSAPSNKALASALKLAKEQRAAVRLLHVADVLPPASVVDGAYVDVDMYRDSVLASARDVSKRAERRARAAGVPARSVILETLIHDPAGEIVRLARAWHADLIVIGTHGRTGLARVFLGSVAEGVVRHAPTAVLLIRGAASRKRRRR